MDTIIGKPNKGPAPGTAIKDGSTKTFMADVIDASAKVAVVVDFWAPWCGPCKQLGPALEKAVTEAKGAVQLVKINVDENPELAQQMRIQSIPAVYAFKDGRPVDGFVGALPDTQVKQFVQRLAALGGGAAVSPIDDALALAKEAQVTGDATRAANIWSQVLQHEPTNVEALVGLARAALAAQDLARAKELVDRIPAEQATQTEVIAVRTALELAEAGRKAAGEIDKLEARLAADSKDHQARLDLAVALFAAGQRERAIDQLFEIIKRDRAWNDDAARKQLLKFFEAIGHADPLTIAARRRLSSMLFA